VLYFGAIKSVPSQVATQHVQSEPIKWDTEEGLNLFAWKKSYFHEIWCECAGHNEGDVLGAETFSKSFQSWLELKLRLHNYYYRRYISKRETSTIKCGRLSYSPR
jgi:hypothetical protein